MAVALLAARLLLAAVFAVAAAAKLADRRGSRQGMADFGVPGRLAGPLGLVIPIAELAVAVALVPRATAWWGALGALALLATFIAGIAVNLAHGRKPDCRCFGQLHSKPVGWRTLARNGFLVAAAGLIVWQGGDDAGASAVAWLGDLTTAELVTAAGATLLLVAVAAEAAFLLNLLRQNGRLLLRIEALERAVSGEAAPEPEPVFGLPVGSTAPSFALPGLYGETLTLDYLRATGLPVLLLFTDPGCGPCNALLPEIGTWQRDYAERLTVALVSRGDAEANREKSMEHGVKNVVLQQGREVAEAYQENGTPAAVVVQPDATIGSPLAAGPDAIRALVARTVGVEPAPAPAAPSPPAAHNGSGDAAAIAAGPQAVNVGDAAPPVRLRDLRGRTVNLAGFRGSKAAVLFWNPGCGFCSQILDDLKGWEAESSEDAPKLLVVSAGDAEANRAMGLRAPVVLDEGFSVGHSFGASGTPSAILVDEEGRIASQLAVGGPSVLALLGATPSGNSAQSAPATAVGRGDEAPAFELPDLEGEMVRLREFRGKETLLLFWNPGCGFCQQMVEELNEWEADRGPDAPEILVVSAGSDEANRQMGLTSRVVLDQNSRITSSFGANGTPMAVLIDETGRVASDVAGGAPAVLSLARGDEPSRLADVAD
jgi:peroxiredoxin